jgi:hypothetical protein
VHWASACALMTAGWISGRGETLIDSRTATEPFVSLGPRLAAEYQFGSRFALRMSADLRIAFTTDRFSVDGMTAWSSSRLDLWLGAALIAHVP